VEAQRRSRCPAFGARPRWYIFPRTKKARKKQGDQRRTEPGRQTEVRREKSASETEKRCRR